MHPVFDTTLFEYTIEPPEGNEAPTRLLIPASLAVDQACTFQLNVTGTERTARLELCEMVPAEVAEGSPNSPGSPVSPVSPVSPSPPASPSEPESPKFEHQVSSRSSTT